MGIGFVMQSTMIITMNSAEPRDMGAASGTVTLLRTVGGSLGVALPGAVFTGRLHGGLADRVGEGAADRLTAGAGQLTPQVLDEVAAPVRVAHQTRCPTGAAGSSRPARTRRWPAPVRDRPPPSSVRLGPSSVRPRCPPATRTRTGSSR